MENSSKPRTITRDNANGNKRAGRDNNKPVQQDNGLRKIMEDNGQLKEIL